MHVQRVTAELKKGHLLSASRFLSWFTLKHTVFYWTSKTTQIFEVHELHQLEIKRFNDSCTLQWSWRM